LLYMAAIFGVFTQGI